MNVQMALFSVTAVPPVLTYLDGITVSAGMVTTIMACFHLVENHVKVSKGASYFICYSNEIVLE